MTDSPDPKITHQRPALRDATAIFELAYGLLWTLSVDKRTERGIAIANARQSLLHDLDRAGQARGIKAARALIAEAQSPEQAPERDGGEC